MNNNRTKAAANAIAGAASAGITTLCAMPCQSTPRDPLCTRAAPTRPPINACDELDGRVFAGIHRFLELLVNVLPADDRKRISLGREELLDRLTVEPVAFVFEIAQLVQLSAGVLESLETPDGLVELLRAAQDHLR